METQINECINCKLKFIPKERHLYQKFCSRKCLIKYHSINRKLLKEKRNKKCIICGKSLEGMFYKTKYCSKECSRKVFNDKRRKIKNKPKVVLCLNCNKEINVKKLGVIPNFCSNICRNSFNYHRNPRKKIEYQKGYYRKNKERFRQRDYISNKEWRNKNRKKFNEIMKKNRIKNIEKYNSRGVTWDVINFSKKRGIILIEKKCKNCGSIDNLEIHHEIYPKNRYEIRKAIHEGRIYYLCKKCHTKLWRKIL